MSLSVRVFVDSARMQQLPLAPSGSRVHPRDPSFTIPSDSVAPMTQRFIYTMKGISKVYPPGRKILDTIWLQFYYGAKIGVLGVNGSGKSTLLRIMAGLDKEIDGEAYLGEGFTVGYLPQEPTLNPDLNVKENIELGLADMKKLLADYEAVAAAYAEPDADYEKLAETQAKLQDAIDACNGWDMERMVEVAMHALDCPPGDSAITHLSGGELRRVALAKLLLEAPDLLLLDEPTNHLDAESVAWLERTLREYKGSVVMVTHDRYFLDNVTGWILELDRSRGVPYEGNYTAWLEQKTKRLAQEEKSESKHQRALKRELEWVRSAPKARQQKQKARLDRYEELRSADVNERMQTAEIVIPHGPRLGNEVLTASELVKSYGERTLINGLSFSLPPAGIVGVIGPNGAGKSTLFRMLTDEEEPTSGTLKMGETVELSYVNQNRDTLDDEKTVYEEISGGNEIIELGDRSVQARAYCAMFNFRGGDQQKHVGKLSGGERNRVHLAKLLKTAGNVLLLDEPTNDLDVDTLRALEGALQSFAGCAVVISHDRWFLDRLATHILAFEGDGHVEWFAGNFQAYELDKRRRLGDDAERNFKYTALLR